MLRRTFLASTVAAPAFARKPLESWPKGLKLSIQVGNNPTDEDLAFVKQLGVGYVNMGLNKATAADFQRMKARVESAGLKVWNIGNPSVHNMEEVTLNLPGRDEKIAEYLEYLRNLDTAGIRYTTYAHMGNGIWSDEAEFTKTGTRGRGFNQAVASKGVWNGKEFRGPLTHGRVYSEKEIWDNFAYFMKRVVPVAEETGIRIGIHPDDPPVPVLGGIPRCIFGNFAGYKRALEIANSPNVGVCLCCGCWLEGGSLMGADVTEAIKYFGGLGKLWKIHFRNVNAPLPHFVETLPDQGYYDMYKIMRALKEVDLRGVIIADHVPAMAGGRQAATAYAVAYMKALIERANAELGA